MGFETEKIALLSKNITTNFIFNLEYIGNENSEYGFFILIGIEGLGFQKGYLTLKFKKYEKEFIFKTDINFEVENFDEVANNCVTSLISNKIINCHFDREKTNEDEGDGYDKHLCWSLS